MNDHREPKSKASDGIIELVSEIRSLLMPRRKLGHELKIHPQSGRQVSLHQFVLSPPTHLRSPLDSSMQSHVLQRYSYNIMTCGLSSKGIKAARNAIGCRRAPSHGINLPRYY